MTKKKASKGHSLFWRKDRKRWCLTFAGTAGWSEPVTKFAPEDLGKRDKKRAERWAALFLQNAEQLDLFPRARPTGIPLRFRVESWKRIRANDPKTSPATLKGYADLFKNVIMRPFKDGRAACCLGDEDVISLGTDLSLVRKWMRAATQDHSASRVRGAFFALRLFFDDAKLERWFRGSNPLQNAALIRELPALPTAKERGGVVHLEEVAAQTLLASDRVPLRRRVRYAVVLTTGGLRDGEIAGLTWSDLELEDAELARLEVGKARRLVRAKDEVLGKTKTSTSNRIVPLHPAARAALIEWRDDEVEGVGVYLGRRSLPSDPVFPSARARDRGAFARPNSPELLRADLEAAELATTVRGMNLTFHALRKTFGNWLYVLDTDELTRKRLLGHGAHDVTAEFYTGESFRKMAAAIHALPLTWTSGVRYAPVRPAFTPKATPALRAGSMTARVLELARARPGASSGTVARELGAKVGTTATTMSKLRAAGLLPPALPGVVSIGRDRAEIANGLMEPPSRFELETYGLRNRARDSASAARVAADVTKQAATTLQVHGGSEVDEHAEELARDAGREGSRGPANPGADRVAHPSASKRPGPARATAREKPAARADGLRVVQVAQRGAAALATEWDRLEEQLGERDGEP